MREAVICEPLRTPVGAFGGSLRNLPAHHLATAVIRAVLERTGLPSESVDDVLLGNCYPTMEAPAIGRVAALDAGLPVTVTGLQIDRRCGSGLQAVIYAAMQVQSGVSEVVLAGGAESMSNAPFYSTVMRWGVGAGSGVVLHDALARGRVTAGGVNHPVPGGMLETAENLRREYGISRGEQDEYAVESHRRAARATEDGRFAEEIVPVVITTRDGDVTVDRDEHIRPDTTVEKLARLRPLLGRDRRTVTAGNAQNDGAAVCADASRPGRGPRRGTRLVSWGVGGVAPATMGIGPVPAVAKALDAAALTAQRHRSHRAQRGLRRPGAGLHAGVVVQCRRLRAAEPQRLRHLARAPGGRHRGPDPGHPDPGDGPARRRFGLETMCIGGGQGLAAVFERV